MDTDTHTGSPTCTPTISFVVGCLLYPTPSLRNPLLFILCVLGVNARRFSWTSEAQRCTSSHFRRRVFHHPHPVGLIFYAQPAAGRSGGQLHEGEGGRQGETAISCLVSFTILGVEKNEYGRELQFAPGCFSPPKGIKIFPKPHTRWRYHTPRR